MERYVRQSNPWTYLDMAYAYAQSTSGCRKVAVGSLITDRNGSIISVGSNKAIPDLCKCRQCLRVEKYGEDSKVHRLPEDCRAIHSEIDAISTAARNGVPVNKGVIYVTRYPCESCAKAIIAAGIETVVYGGTTKISDQTKDMFQRFGVSYTYIDNWKEDNSDR